MTRFEQGFYDRMQKQAQSNVVNVVNNAPANVTGKQPNVPDYMKRDGYIINETQKLLNRGRDAFRSWYTNRTTKQPR